MSEPEMQKQLSPSCVAFEHLLTIMATLRSPHGCPWDAEQTPESLKPYLLEETYEVLEALDRNEPQSICEELGDLLLQIVFHARIFEERGLFTMADVSDSIAAKLIRRHPHVFAAAQISSEQALATEWNRIKEEENQAKGRPTSLLGNIPQHLPALQKASKLATRLTPAEAQDTIVQEVQTGLHALIAALGAESKESLDTRLGMLLFNLARMGNVLHIDAEDALRRVNNQKVERYRNASIAPAGKD